MGRHVLTLANRVDLSGGYFQDSQPRFPQPFDTIAYWSRLHLPTTPMPRTTAGEDLATDPAIARICDLMRQASTLIDTDSLVRGDDLWRDVLFTPFHLHPPLHDLLSLPRCSSQDHVHTRRREVFRLAAIIYLTELRKRFTIDDAPAIIYDTKLTMVLATLDMAESWGESNVFLIWSLVVAASCSCVHREFRPRHLQRLTTALRTAGVKNFDELWVMVCNFMWSEAAMATSLAALEHQLPPSPW